MSEYWSKYHESLHQALLQTTVTNTDKSAVAVAEGLAIVCTWTKELQALGGTLHFVGNGGSACMASHLALDWSQNADVRATTCNDIASITAIGNDLGYDHVFAAPLRRHARPGDVLATVSSSGNSPNVIRAIEAAREMGLRVITFSGMKPDNKSHALGDVNFYVPAWSYGIVECAHQVLLHAWLDHFMGVREWAMTRPQFS